MTAPMQLLETNRVRRCKVWKRNKYFVCFFQKEVYFLFLSLSKVGVFFIFFVSFKSRYIFFSELPTGIVTRLASNRRRAPLSSHVGKNFGLVFPWRGRGGRGGLPSREHLRLEESEQC